MTVHTICDRCGMEYEWAGVSIGDLVYCCMGCANGGPCTCPVAHGTTTVVTGGGTTVVTPGVGGTTVVTGGTVVGDDVVIVE